MSAKPEGVADGNFYFSLLSFVKGKVEPGIKVFINVEIVDGGGYHAFINGQ